MNDFGSELPKCDICSDGKARMIINGKFMCGKCVIKWSEYQTQKSMESMKGFEEYAKSK